jgi:hypothetical protein
MVLDQFGNLGVMGTASTPLLTAADESKALLNSLTTFGVPLVTGDERYVKAVRSFVGAFPSIGVWRLTQWIS